MSKSGVGYNPLSNFHCDEPLHGYGCYHLDKPKKSSRLDEKEQKELNRLVHMYAIETLDAAERAVEEANGAAETARDTLYEREGELEDLENLVFLWEKSGLDEEDVFS